MFVNHFGHKGPRPIARPLLMAAFYELKAAVSDFYSAAKSAARRPACFEIFRCRDPKERQVEGYSDASCSLAWAVPFVEIKFRAYSDVSIGKAEHPSTPELRKISIWRRFLSFASFPFFFGKERK